VIDPDWKVEWRFEREAAAGVSDRSRKPLSSRGDKIGPDRCTTERIAIGAANETPEVSRAGVEVNRKP
jgi:hypothetical protein